MRHLPHRHASKRVVAFLMFTVLLLAWLFIGISLGYSDDEPRASLFVKKYATFKITFPNPDDAESDYLPFPALSKRKQDAIVAYCKYRFGIVSMDVARIEECRRQGRYFTRSTRTP